MASRYALVVVLVVLAGCLGPTTHIVLPDDRVLVAEEGAARLEATVTGDDGVRIHATGSWHGNEAPRVWGLCHSPWDGSGLVRDGRPVQTKEPVATCMGMSCDVLGGPRDAAFHWDGLVWDGSERVPAEPGDYAFHLRFEVLSEGCERTLARVVLDVPLQVR